MNNRRKLLTYSKIYDVSKTDDLFLKAIKETIRYHIKNNKKYAKIVKLEKFKVSDLKSIKDIHLIPALPTLFLKSNPLFTKSKKSIIVSATTSGTSGKKSTVGIDLNSGFFALIMTIRCFKHFKLFSLIPTNYIILGYQPSKENKAGITKTAFGFTLITPALNRAYALKYTKDGYKLDLDGLINTLIKYEKQGLPVRLMGLPAFHYLLLTTLKERGIKLKLHKKSYLCLGGGWKQYYFENADKGELFKLAYEVLGIKDSNCIDFFGAVEHPVLYTDCKNHNFHVPIYARVIIRDEKTLKPVGYGKAGILNLISPLMLSMPLNSIMTDDLAILHRGEECGCGNKAPYFELLGRAGLHDLKTCAVTASEFLTK